VKTTPSLKHHHKDAAESQKSPSQSIKILEHEITQNMPESQIWASGPVTTLIPRFYLGDESRFEDHDSTLFYALKRKTHQ